MKYFYVFFIFILTTTLATAQETPAYFRITFKDKSNNPFSISNPSEFLSEKAIERRKKMDIQINQSDIPITPSYISNIINTGAMYINSSKWFNSIVVYIKNDSTVNQISSNSTIKTIEKISKTDTIKKIKTSKSENYIKQDFSTTINSLITNHIPLSSYEYNYGLAFRQINIHNGQYLHMNGFIGSDILIAILDVGFIGVSTLSAFENIRQNRQIIATKDFTIPNGDVFSSGSHGTYILSVIAAFQEGTMIGTAPGSNFLLLRTEVENSENLVEEDNWCAGVEYADSCGADIISSSLGYSTFDDTTHNHTYSMLDGKTTRVAKAATMASRKGMLVINSAGNSGNKKWYYIGTPADADSILTVGAVNPFLNYAPFSSKGPTADNRIKPDVCAIGEDAYIISISGKPEPANGTSFSAPIISGLAACLWQKFPDKSNIDIRNAIIKSANTYNSPNNFIGYGIPDFFKASLLLLNNPAPFEPYFTASSNGTELTSILQANKSGLYKFTIYNLQAKPVASFEEECQTGYNYLNINLTTKILNGIYILETTINGEAYKNIKLSVNGY